MHPYISPPHIRAGLSLPPQAELGRHAPSLALLALGDARDAGRPAAALGRRSFLRCCKIFATAALRGVVSPVALQVESRRGWVLGEGAHLERCAQCPASHPPVALLVPPRHCRNAPPPPSAPARLRRVVSGVAGVSPPLSARSAAWCRPSERYSLPRAAIAPVRRKAFMRSSERQIVKNFCRQAVAYEGLGSDP